MRSRSNGGVIGAYALPTQQYANGVFFIHDAAIFNTGSNPIWPLATGYFPTFSNTGGTSVVTSANNSSYKLATFNTSGTLTLSAGSGYVDILVVGGGGAGGGGTTTTTTQFAGGGGGAGAVISYSFFVNGPTVFTCTPGGGGAGSSSTNGANGSSSSITSNTGLSLTAAGGGWASGYSTGNAPSTVGSSSGGGSGWYLAGTPSYVNMDAGPRSNSSPQLGNIGGIGYANANGSLFGGGGGGAGSVGYTGNTQIVAASVASYGGDGYYWNKNGLYYGAGGPGAKSTILSVNQIKAYSGLYGNAQQNPGVNYSTIYPSQSGTAGVPNYGMGGSGAYAGTSAAATGGAGGSGTILIYFKYQ